MGESKYLDKMLSLKPTKQLILPLSLAGLILVSATAIYTVNQSAQRESAQSASVQTKVPEIQAVTAIGRIEPQGEMIKLAPSPDLGGTKIAQLLVQEGDRVKQGQTIAILDNYDRSQAAVAVAEQEVKVAEANLAVVKAGAKQGDITAQAAQVNRVKAELQGKLVTNDAEVARLQAQLRTETAEKQATIDRLQAELNNAQSDFQRYQKLAQDGVISDSELDSRRLKVDTAQKSLTEAQATYNRTLTTLQEQIKQAQAIAQQDRQTLQQQITEAEATLDSIAEVRDVDVIQAQAQLNKASAQLQQAKADFAQTYVKAPTDGQILKINAYPGELVNQEDGVVEFGQTNRMMVIAEVYESDISKVKVGQTATVRSETGAFPGEITGKVEQIGLRIGKQAVFDTDPAADVDSRVVEVKILLDPNYSDRVAGLTNSKAIVKIDISQ
ncbi:ABC exporter membrane fusion protein, DevB family [Stanieria cyanosphaera PCC 7437]|uniref:ABC exporter membrane fusion protein, DevB family n=1 Tax=Stanieria cyanosphaera (strain ATCC 29371 / PCC 7437) TaxID=111780 RepID=K9XS94_STAC7|nr:ABC exporter membrane fusion protein [Stanieria cyanosphaera]AFZ34954.1 ABC exporter membrane fusion protein, DevB family [Stanieria cyanosphaera PCC 7437]